MPVHRPSSFAPFLLAELLLCRAEEPIPFLFYFVHVMLATPTALTFSVMALHVSVSVLLVTLSVNLLCKMPLFSSSFPVIIGSNYW